MSEVIREAKKRWKQENWYRLNGLTPPKKGPDPFKQMERAAIEAEVVRKIAQEDYRRKQEQEEARKREEQARLAMVTTLQAQNAQLMMQNNQMQQQLAQMQRQIDQLRIQSKGQNSSNSFSQKSS